MPGVGLLMGYRADGAFGMVCSVLVVVKGRHQSGKQQQSCQEKREALEHYIRFHAMKNIAQTYLVWLECQAKWCATLR